ncbi:unnamed protein product [Effrenium voratum]|uniref:Uncharacterized protein n=1 Tax=Effrenium voratum TaxID=2562239 RepID=A0AA36NLC6_9DINO|nr:unnamed protein product [Effrenium voratum]
METIEWERPGVVQPQEPATTQVPNELPQPPAPSFTVETYLPEGTPLATCHGYEEQWALCKQQSCGDEHQIINCQWSEWGPWKSFGGCSGLGVRERKIARHHETGGRPCSGVKEETRQMDQFFDDDCLQGDQNCEWSPWSDWSHCGCEVCARTARLRR